MPQDVVVVFVHGINTTCQDYYEPLRDRIHAALPKAAKPHAIFKAVFWADIVRGRQQEYLQYAKTSPAKFRANDFHRMVIEGLGDAAAYQKTKERRNSAYYEIQGRVRKTIRDAALPGADDRPLVFIAHSLGCHIASSYAWDLHKFKYPQPDYPADPEEAWFTQSLKSATAFERLDTFAGFVTMGSNMPLFTFTFGPQYVFPITHAYHPHAAAPFPGIALDDHTSAISRWENYYNRHDALGFPLKPLNDAYDDEKRLQDHQLGPRSWGRIFGKYAMLTAHNSYWTDPQVARGAAALIADIVQAPERRPIKKPLVTLFP